MKIQCNVCETAEATVLCCADEAALCDVCDDKVHAANKLASKHQRLSLSHSPSHSPICDICQEAVGYFFCLEDRALLCRQCDIAIHTVNSFVSAHQRFLLTGVKVGLEAAEPGSSSSRGRTQSVDRGSDYADNRDAPTAIEPASTTTRYDRTISGHDGAADIAFSNKRSMPMSMSEYARIQPVQNGTLEDLTQSRMNFAGGSNSGNLSQWPLEEFLGMSDFHHNYSFTGNGSSTADSGKLGSSDSSTFLRSLEVDLDSDDQMGQVPEVSWAVPEIHSPPTASGLYWPERSQQLNENTPFVPDISWSQSSNSQHYQPKHNAGKRRRQT
ncbi:B-box zinc finger protein 22-like [Silene latifolia]|uniref:B-box zinc finger protein 22-like n=1 Tax=Silene latifolia TaxID=37657 RepID=UPI003D7769F2